MRAVTGKPIRFVGVGEKLDALEEFHPERVAGRILGMGDIVALVEKAQETIEADQASKMMKRFQKGQFNMNDLRSQLEQMIKMGGMQSLIGMMPGMGKISKKMEVTGFDDKSIRRQIAIIQSMTKREKLNPLLLQASRKKRIAGGSGTEVQELNRLLKMHRQMSDMMKKLGRTGNKGMLRGMMGQMMGKGMGAPTLPENIGTGISQTPFGNLSALNLPNDLSGLGKKNR
jgi:signal recognition particle subunit SRP54